MHVYKTQKVIIVHRDNEFYWVHQDWDELINRSNLHEYLEATTLTTERIKPVDATGQIEKTLLPPIGRQEVWAAGVTYLRSRNARIEESRDGGGADFYSLVYEAERPELFQKALPHRVVGSGQDIAIRKDSSWNVPEPELTLFINSEGEIQAYTIGNDVSSRSIEGENPLYLPQAKSYERSCALGPCLYVPPNPIPLSTQISITIRRSGLVVFSDSIQLNKMKRSFNELAGWLYLENKFPFGCLLMTGTGIVPPAQFSLVVGDEVSIAIEGIGTLTNRVSYN